MNFQEAWQTIDTLTHNQAWTEGDTRTLIAVIRAFVGAVTEEPEQAAKKVTKRRVRKAKPAPAPLTQHAEGVGEYAAKLISGHGN